MTNPTRQITAYKGEIDDILKSLRTQIEMLPQEIGCSPNESYLANAICVLINIMLHDRSTINLPEVTGSVG